MADVLPGKDGGGEPIRIIYYGDNLDILRANVSTGSVDLVYLDPPFKSQQQYNLLFRTARGEPATAQVRAFSDTWKWTTEAKATCEDLIDGRMPGQRERIVPGRVSKMIEAFAQFLGEMTPGGMRGSEMLAYLVMMTPRLLELHRVLKPTGSLYLHCDPAASHYLKIVLDTIFGPQNFRNEVVWRRSFTHGDAKQGAKHFGRCTDSLLFYVKTDMAIWNPQYAPYSEEALKRDYKYTEERTRRVYRLAPVDGPGGASKGNPYYDFLGVKGYWRFTQEKMQKLYDEGRIVRSSTGKSLSQKMYLDEAKGRPVDNLWDDVNRISPTSSERLGYPTQKPLVLLKRIIQASTNPGDLVLDPFCGCGTALAAAEELGRSWIGIDVTYLAVDVMARRLRDHFSGISFEIRGQPQDEEGAKALAERDRFQFQAWALSQVGAQSLDPDRKGADRGIDGYLPFQIGREKHERAVVQVKSGHVGVREVRDLRGTLEREKAPFALLITLEHPTAAMGREAVDAGFYRVPATGEEVPRLQIITVRELLQGQRPKMPTTQVSPVPQAPRLRRTGGRQLPL